ncbi:GALNT [Lepeophtheirus salmonis]|nr:GALNT [Lepeophtheirus salmonis]CAF2884960.1 GALNT [Lepeophtheirus salmonis]
MRNYKRVIETWFDDEYKESFYTREPMAKFVDMGDISEQLALKKKLNCKSFDWFMKEVAYDVLEKYPKLPPNAKWGEFRNEATNLCLDTRGQHPPEKTLASSCHGMGGNQMFRLNTEGQLTSGEWCQTADSSGSVSIQWCSFGSVSGPWEFKENLRQIYHRTYKMCLALLPDSNSLVLRSCDKDNSHQKWSIKTLKPYWSS